jgi:hypothetical protein
MRVVSLNFRFIGESKRVEKERSEREKENDLFTPACPLEEDDRNSSLG